MKLVEKGTIAAMASSTVYCGNAEIVLPAGKSLKIETSPQGEEILDITAGAADEVVTLEVTRRVPA